MGADDEISNAAEEAWGKVKEETGDLTGNEKLEAEGAADQVAANAQQAGEDVKDAAGEAADAVGEAFDR